MPWKERSTMDAREEFCLLALADGSNVRELCRRFGISPTTGYTWMGRYQTHGRAGLANRSRRPHSSPWQSDAATEAVVCALRAEHPRWGGRKLAAVLAMRGHEPVPCPATITAILRRHGLLDVAEAAKHRPVSRFCAPFPNALWQMDYKGHFALASAGRCHPLTVLDDHSRFNLALRALPNEQQTTVQDALRVLFGRYGLPNRILCDNGSPWGNPRGGQYTALGIWLLHLDVQLIHGHPYHPQTQGKEERFHRTLGEEVLAGRTFGSLDEAQRAFDAWRAVYNQQRPHEALGLVPPITCYQPSQRVYPTELPPITYPPSMQRTRVNAKGELRLGGRSYFVGDALYGYPLGLRPTPDAAVYDVVFRHYVVARIDRRAPTAP